MGQTARNNSSPSTSRAGRALAAALAITLGVVGAFSCRRAAKGPSFDATRDVSPSGPASAPARSAPAGSELAASERAVVDDFLRRHPDLRSATDADRRGSADSDADMRNLYGVYHPYFVRGDVNDDGVLDFVAAFVRRETGRAPRFSIVAFLGRAGAGGVEFSSGTFIERDISLVRGDVSIDRDSIVITPDLDEDAVRRYRWDPAAREFIFVRDSDDETDPPSVSRTKARVTPVEF
jgi:hypothetical protein